MSVSTAAWEMTTTPSTTRTRSRCEQQVRAGAEQRRGGEGEHELHARWLHVDEAREVVDQDAPAAPATSRNTPTSNADGA